MQSSGKKINVNNDKGKLRTMVQKIPHECFDDHTEFDELTPEQKLEWLSQCARFVSAVNSNKRVKGKINP